MKFTTVAILLGGASSVAAAVPGFRAFPVTTTSSSTTAAATTTSSKAAVATTTSTKAVTTTASSTTTGFAFARPTAGVPVCLSNSTANYLVNGFASLLTAYTTSTAEALLASDFTDTSDSINFLAGYPLGSTTFPSKAAFEAGQGSQQSIGFTVTSIDAVTCNTIAFRWTANVGGTDPVKGIDIFIASNLNGTDAGWQIKTVYSEFNSAAWMVDIGGSCGFSS